MNGVILPPEDTHEELLRHIETYLVENSKFESNGNKSAGTRARNALRLMVKLAKERRKEIQSSKKENE